jgi:hypothetical protein
MPRCAGRCNIECTEAINTTKNYKPGFKMAGEVQPLGIDMVTRRVIRNFIRLQIPPPYLRGKPQVAISRNVDSRLEIIADNPRYVMTSIIFLPAEHFATGL